MSNTWPRPFKCSKPIACTFLCDIQLINVNCGYSYSVTHYNLRSSCPFCNIFSELSAVFVICYICQWVNRKSTVLCSLLIHSCKKYKYMEHKEPIVLSRGLLWSVPRLTFNSFIMWASMYTIMSLCRMSIFVTMRLKEDRDWFDGEEAEDIKGVTGCWSVWTKSKARN